MVRDVAKLVGRCKAVNEARRFCRLANSIQIQLKHEPYSRVRRHTLVTGIGFGLFKLQQFVTGNRKRRSGSFDDQPSMMDWLVGRDFWDRWR